MDIVTIVIACWSILTGLVFILALPPNKVPLKVFWFWVTLSVLLAIARLVPAILLPILYLIMWLLATFSYIVAPVKTGMGVQTVERNSIQGKDVGVTLIGAGSVVGAVQKIDENSTNTTPEFIVEATKGGYQYANLRTEPSMQKGAILNKLPNGTSISILNSENRNGSKWYYILVNSTDQKGWIHSNMIAKIN